MMDEEEEEEGQYVDKYSPERVACHTERIANEDSSTDRVLTDTSGTSDENSTSRKPILEQDRFLPIANISRLMKNVIPRSGKVAKDAKECVQECVSEFISFITSEACERCLNEKRKTITGEDIIGAFSTLGFDNYVEPLTAYVRKFREAFRTDRNSEALLVETSGSHHTILDTTSTHNTSESVPTSEVFTIHTESMPSSSTCASQIIFAGEEDLDAVRVVSTGNVQHLQLLMDPTTGQHYINVQNPNGTQQLLPVQVTAVAESPGTPVTLHCPDTQNLPDCKTADKEMPGFSTRTEFQPSLSKSETMTSAEYKEASQVTRNPEEHPKNGAAYGTGLKHGSSARSMANHHKQQVQYIGALAQFGHHHSNASDLREPSRKRSHESVDYISFE